MLNILTYDKDKITKGELGHICHPRKFTWVDLFRPTEHELKTIADATGMPLTDLKISTAEDERPKIIEFEGPFSLIIFGAPSFENGEVTTTPVFIYASKYHNCVIAVRNKDTKSISRLKESIETKKTLFDKGSSYFVYRLLDEILNTYFMVLDDIDNRIDQIEDGVISNPDIKDVKKIFQTKKTLIYFTKTITANREVIASIEKEYLSEIDKKMAKQFRNLYDETIQLIDMSTAYRDILTGTLDTYLTSISNSLNKIMKTLTVITAFTLLPTLIASIYGMNFRWLPELGWKYGYFLSLGLMLLSVVLMWAFFKQKKWI